MMKRALLLLAGLLFLAAGLLAYSFAPRTLPIPADLTAATFATAQRPAPAQLPAVSLSILKAGKMPANQAFAYRGGSFRVGSENGMAAVLVRHPRASFLIDGGFGANVDQHWQYVPRLLRALSTYVKETPPAEQLRQAGVPLSEIRFAIITHSHWDHISGLEDFPGLEVRMPAAERQFIADRKMPGLIDAMIGKMNVRTFEFTGGPYENFARSLDLFDDGSVVLVPLPGHTDGSTGVFVNLRSGKRYFFIGDLTWSLQGVRLPAERPWIARRLVDIDPDEVRRSVVQVHLLSKRYPELIVVPAHDRRVHEQIAAFPAVEQ